MRTWHVRGQEADLRQGGLEAVLEDLVRLGQTVDGAYDLDELASQRVRDVTRHPHEYLPAEPF